MRLGPDDSVIWLGAVDLVDELVRCCVGALEGDAVREVGLRIARMYGGETLVVVRTVAESSRGQAAELFAAVVGEIAA